MKQVLFDHSTPAPLARFLTMFAVRLSDEMGWSRLRNGQLLTIAEQSGFDVLLSGDKSMKTEQNMAGRKIALLYMSANHWPIVRHHVPSIVQSINDAKPGDVKPVYCGTFLPKNSARVKLKKWAASYLLTNRPPVKSRIQGHS